MKNFLKISVYVVLGLGLCSCSRFQSSTPSYLTDAQQAPPLTIPQGASAPKEETTYVVPSTASEKDQPVSVIPPGSRISQYQVKKKQGLSNANTHRSQVAMSDSKQSLFLSLTPSEAWQPLAQALQASNMPILKSDGASKRYSVVDVGKTGMHLTKQSPVYTFSLSSSTKGSELTVAAQSGTALSAGQVTQLLTTVKQHFAA